MNQKVIDSAAFLKKLFVSGEKGELSHTKLWSNIGYFLMCLMFVRVTESLLKNTPFPTRDWMELLVAFGSLVAIPRGFSKWLNAKNKSEETPKAS